MIPDLRVASWNLHEGLPDGEDGSAPPADTSAEIVRLLVETRADVVGFQEVDLDGDGESAILEAVRRRTPLTYLAVHRLSESSFFPGHFAGVAIASRYPLADVRRTLLPNPRLTISLGGVEIGSHDKGYIAATIMAPGGPMNVVSLHAVPFHIFGRAAGETAFRDVWSALVSGLQPLAVRPLVVCGDFNTADRLVFRDEALDLGTAIEGRPTYRDLALDDILYTPDLQAKNVRIFDNFSDHALCLAEFYRR